MRDNSSLTANSDSVSRAAWDKRVAKASKSSANTSLLSAVIAARAQLAHPSFTSSRISFILWQRDARFGGITAADTRPVLCNSAVMRHTVSVVAAYSRSQHRD